MPKAKLFDDDDSEKIEFSENTEYSKNYDQWRRKEETHKAEARTGKKIDSKTDLEEVFEDSSSSDDDDGEEKIPEDFDKSFYKALAALKTKDPKIYDGGVKFFKDVNKEEEENKEQPNNVKLLKKQKEKGLFLKDYESKMALEKRGDFVNSDDEEEETNKMNRNPTYVQEQQEIKNSLKKALQEEDDDDEEDNFLKPKVKTKEEIQKEEDDYAEFLRGQKEDMKEEDVKELKPLRDFWTDPNLDKNEKFLRDYILNKGVLDNESYDIDLDYEQKFHDSDENLSEDERNLEKQEEFEHKYNFRFEEPDEEFIKRYPRTIESSLRKKDTRRAQKRAEVKARKEQEKVQMREELKQLKAMKRKEIEEKLEKLKEITGNDDLNFAALDLDEDYDPEKYDKQMKAVFNEDYYAGEEGDIKPEFPEIDEELAVESTWDNYDPTTDEIVDDDTYNGAPHCEDPDFNMDADYDGKKNLQDELIDSTKKRKRRRRSKFAEMISKEKPKFDPKMHPSFKEYYDQYYALDYEDMIGDLPCRFKYRQVVPNDFGLSVEEILMADDKELNKWCSLKKALEYKPDDKELVEVRKFKQKASNEALKKKILKSLYSNQEEEENPAPLETVPHTAKSSKKRKKNKKSADQSNSEKDVAITVEVAQQQNQEPPKKKKKNKNKKGNADEIHTGQNSKSSIKAEVKDEEPSASTSQEIPVPKNKKKKANAEMSPANAAAESEVKKGKGDIATSEKNMEVTPNSASKTESVSEKKKNKRQKNIDKKLHKIENGGISKPDKQALKNKIKNGNEKLSKKEQRKLLFKKKNAKLKEKESKESKDQINFLSDERLKAYGLNPKKFKNKLKYGKKK